MHKPISFKQFLIETQLDSTELIEKTARSGENENKWRTFILKKMIEDETPFELKNGDKIVVDKSAAIVKHLLSFITSNERIIGHEAEQLKDFLKKQKPFVDKKTGTAYKLTDIKKTAEFGGGSKGSGGGSADTEKNESLQCVALALRVKKGKKLEVEDLSDVDAIKDVEDKYDISYTYTNQQELADR